MIRAILFDAAGTLFFLTKTVGDHYAYVGHEVGLDLDAQELDRAFHTAWQAMPRRFAIAASSARVTVFAVADGGPDGAGADAPCRS